MPRRIACRPRPVSCRTTGDNRLDQRERVPRNGSSVHDSGRSSLSSPRAKVRFPLVPAGNVCGYEGQRAPSASGRHAAPLRGRRTERSPDGARLGTSGAVATPRGACPKSRSARGPRDASCLALTDQTQSIRTTVQRYQDPLSVRDSSRPPNNLEILSYSFHVQLFPYMDTQRFQYWGPVAILTDHFSATRRR